MPRSTRAPPRHTAHTAQVRRTVRGVIVGRTTYERFSIGYRYPMMVRLLIAFAGFVALLVGIGGLLVPASVSPELAVVSCGSAIAPDLSEARSQDDGNAANVEVADELIADTNYTRLCEMELEDRRLLSIPLAIAGVLTIGAAVALSARSRRAKAPS